MGTLAFIYGALSYAVFLAVFLYAIGFVGNFLVPKSIDSGAAGALGYAVAIDVALLGLFAVQHSVMARPAFKRWWTRFVPTSIERSTYVLLASLALFVLYWQWRTMPAIVWDVTWRPAVFVLWTLFALGWLTVLASTFMINHFDLFGLRQVYLAWRGEPYTDLEFRTSMLYRTVRHPIMVGFIVAFWATPTMTAGHLLFASVTTGYILVAIQLEEHDLSAVLGDDYRDYRSRVGMLVPGLHRHGGDTGPDTTARPA
jgi:protein-S-isoprenylcysteine O-methyltransferase Ste14